jgi:hypothetical protein
MKEAPTEAALLRDRDPHLFATGALVHAERAAVRSRVLHFLHEARFRTTSAAPEFFQLFRLATRH